MPKPMVRTQIKLSSQQRKILLALATRYDVSMAEMIRRFIDQGIEAEEAKRGAKNASDK